MAILSRIKCSSCGEEADVMHSPAQSAPRRCGKCKEAELADARARFFLQLDGMSVEERLRRVEEWIYDYRAPVPLSEMRF